MEQANLLRFFLGFNLKLFAWCSSRSSSEPPWNSCGSAATERTSVSGDLELRAWPLGHCDANVEGGSDSGKERRASRKHHPRFPSGAWIDLSKNKKRGQDSALICLQRTLRVQHLRLPSIQPAFVYVDTCHTVSHLFLAGQKTETEAWVAMFCMF